MAYARPHSPPISPMSKDPFIREKFTRPHDVRAHRRHKGALNRHVERVFGPSRKALANTIILSSSRDLFLDGNRTWISEKM
jgi:hypothetical protein